MSSVVISSRRLASPAALLMQWVDVVAGEAERDLVEG
jgi:hypothetical protein